MTEDQKSTRLDAAKSLARRTIDPIKRNAPDMAESALRQASSAMRTKTGGRALTGAAAGAAIAAALPFVSVAAGALVGAGALVFWKSIKDTG